MFNQSGVMAARLIPCFGCCPPLVACLGGEALYSRLGNGQE
jgi:hypothetical protein